MRDNGVDRSRLEAFTAAWQTGDVPELREYVPADVRPAELFDLIRVDLRHRWTRTPGLGKRLTQYCAEFPEIEPATLPPNLIFEEFVIRRDNGQSVEPGDYLAEFPEQSAGLRALMHAADNDEATMFAGAVTFEGDETRVTSDRTEAVPYDPSMTVATGTSAAATAAFVRPDEPEALDTLHIGQSLDDFDLLTALGSGAFARVFLARQRSMQRLVAVKISADRGTEPQTLAQLDHDYIVRVFDQRLLPEQRLRLLYMQFLPGGTLLGVLRWVRETPPEQRSGRLLLDAIDAAMEEKGEIRPTDSSVRSEIAHLSWPETVAWLGTRLAEALDYAGSRGVLHRDVKPANILLTSEGVPKLADFNISFSRNVEGASPVAYFGGSLSYMSPEQLEAAHPGLARTAAELDTRSDIFSLGVVLWELLCGRKPFGDETIVGGDRTTLDTMLARRHSGVEPAQLADLPPDCPATLRRVLLVCLAPNPDDRWTRGTELAQQFELCLDARARNLVDPPPNSLRLKARRWVFPIIALAVGVPNALASIYNIHHNQTLIISRLSAETQQRFELITAIVNVTFFPAAAVLMIYASRYVLSVPRGLRKGKSYDAATLARARRDTLLAGDRIVVIAFSGWMLAGLTFPITLQLVAGNIPANAVVHFIASLAVCGAMALAYPFFIVSFYVVRCLYPTFLSHGGTGADDAFQLRGLDRRSNFYLAVAASVPLLGVAGITFLPADIPLVIVAVRVLCVGSIIAFVLAYWLFRQVEADLRALERVVSPAER